MIYDLKYIFNMRNFKDPQFSAYYMFIKYFYHLIMPQLSNDIKLNLHAIFLIND